MWWDVGTGAEVTNESVVFSSTRMKLIFILKVNVLNFLPESRAGASHSVEDD